MIKENGMEQTILQFVMDEIKQNKRMIEDLTKKQIEGEIQQGNYNFILMFNKLYMIFFKSSTTKKYL